MTILQVGQYIYDEKLFSSLITKNYGTAEQCF